MRGRGMMGWGPAALGFALIAETAGATVGGPTLLEVLGYDRVDRKVFFVHHDLSQEGRAPELSYVALASPRPDKRVRVPGPRRATGRDLSEHLDQIERIRKRVVPLRPRTVLDLRWSVDTLASDAPADAFGDRLARRRLRVRLSAHDFAKVLELTAYGTGEVRLAAVHALPVTLSREGTVEEEPVAGLGLGVLAWHGDPTEGGQEVQMPFLFTREPVRFVGVRQR